VPRTAAETQARVRAGLARRYRAERRFRAYGLAAVALGISFVVFLFGTVLSQGLSVLRQGYVQLDIIYDPEVIDPAGTRLPDDLAVADYQALVRAALRERFPYVEGRPALRELYGLVSSAASVELQKRVTGDPGLIRRTNGGSPMHRSRGSMRCAPTARCSCASTARSSPTAIRATPSRRVCAARWWARSSRS